jgi:hypothetical protein
MIWLNMVNQYFKFYHTPDGQRVMLVAFRLEEEAN